MDLETKEITLAKQQANKLTQKVEEIKITSTATLETAKLTLSEITGSQKIIKGLRESMTKPINEGLKRIRELFAPVEDNLKLANEGLKGKMMTYNEKIKKEVEEKKAQITEKVENGDVNFDKASKQMEKVDQKVEAIPTRKIREIEIVDEAKIPKQYWELNMVSIRRDALAGVQIEGVKVIEKEIIVSR